MAGHQWRAPKLRDLADDTVAADNLLPAVLLDDLDIDYAVPKGLIDRASTGRTSIAVL